MSSVLRGHSKGSKPVISRMRSIGQKSKMFQLFHTNRIDWISTCSSAIIERSYLHSDETEEQSHAVFFVIIISEPASVP